MVIDRRWQKMWRHLTKSRFIFSGRRIDIVDYVADVNEAASD